jgi:tol-pal system protein YbgF
MKLFIHTAGAILLVALLSFFSGTSSALAADNEPNNIQLQQQIDEIKTRITNRIEPINGRLETKADKKSIIEINNYIERLTTDIANLRNQIEMLTNELINGQRRQKDFYTDLDARLRKLEPQKQSVDGKKMEIEQAEQKAFESALALFKSADYTSADQAFNSFIQRYPDSGYTALAYYWLGSTHFALLDCAKAIPAYQIVSSRFPESQRAAESLLNMASCYSEMNDIPAAKEALENLIKKYPKSVASALAQERLKDLE